MVMIAVDWGTTNRRAYRLDDDGQVTDTLADDRGVLGLASADYPAEIEGLRQRFGDLPVVIAGMAGSNRGWREIPYIPIPADAAALADGAMVVADRVTLLPGVALDGGSHCDVMRGEEVQVIGAIAAGLAPPDALFCQPGTHSKWIIVAAGKIVDFSTRMTGETFALLGAHGVLAGMLDAPVTVGMAFCDGLVRGAAGADPFEARAAVLLGQLASDDAASFVSGTLIGGELARQGALAGRAVHLLAAPPLADLYAAAIDRQGGNPTVVDSAAAFAAGMATIVKGHA